MFMLQSNCVNVPYRWIQPLHFETVFFHFVSSIKSCWVQKQAADDRRWTGEKTRTCERHRGQRGRDKRGDCKRQRERSRLEIEETLIIYSPSQNWKHWPTVNWNIVVNIFNLLFRIWIMFVPESLKPVWLILRERLTVRKLESS